MTRVTRLGVELWNAELFTVTKMVSFFQPEEEEERVDDYCGDYYDECPVCGFV